MAVNNIARSALVAFLRDKAQYARDKASKKRQSLKLLQATTTRDMEIARHVSQAFSSCAGNQITEVRRQHVLRLVAQSVDRMEQDATVFEAIASELEGLTQ